MRLLALCCAVCCAKPFASRHHLPYFFLGGAITGLNIKESKDNNVFGFQDSA